MPIFGIECFEVVSTCQANQSLPSIIGNFENDGSDDFGKSVFSKTSNSSLKIIYDAFNEVIHILIFG